MIEFRKIPEKDEYDKTEVCHVIRQKDVGLQELLEDFMHFLSGCGYVIDPESTLEIVSPEENKEQEEIDIELENEALMTLVMEAHRQDITLNELCNNLLKESLKDENTELWSTLCESINRESKDMEDNRSTRE